MICFSVRSLVIMACVVGMVSVALALPPPEIALDHANGGRTILASVLRAGDIIATTTPSKFPSAIIREKTGADVSHAALYIGDGTVIEAIGEGVTIRPLAEVLGEASLAVAFRHPRLTTTQARQLTEIALSKLGQKFNFGGLIVHPRFGIAKAICDALPPSIRQSCQRWRGRVQVSLEANRLFCSQLVFTAFHDVGLPLGPDPAASAPGDIAIASLVEELTYVGHLKTIVR